MAYVKRRTKWNARRDQGNVKAFIRGLAAAIGVTALCVVVFALIVGLTNAADGVIHVINQLIKLSAIFFGVRICVPRGDKGGTLRGALLGFLYMAAGVAVYALLTKQMLTWEEYLLDALMGVSAGGLFGMLRACAKEKETNTSSL